MAMPALSIRRMADASYVSYDLYSIILIFLNDLVAVILRFQTYTRLNSWLIKYK